MNLGGGGTTASAMTTFREMNIQVRGLNNSDKSKQNLSYSKAKKEFGLINLNSQPNSNEKF